MREAAGEIAGTEGTRAGKEAMVADVRGGEDVASCVGVGWTRRAGEAGAAGREGRAIDVGRVLGADLGLFRAGIEGTAP